MLRTVVHRCLVAGLTALVLGVASPAEALAETVERSRTVVEPFVEESPYCTDESILWSGYYENVFTPRSSNIMAVFDGIGLVSGDAYRLTFKINTAFAGGDAHETIIYGQRSRNGTPDYLAHTTSNQVVLPSGEFVLTFDDFTGFQNCVGAPPNTDL
jgi:hypothetical protein